MTIGPCLSAGEAVACWSTINIKRGGKMKTYIQRKDGKQLETVDEFDTRKEAIAMLVECRFSDQSAQYYLSTRPCKAWEER